MQEEALVRARMKAREQAFLLALAFREGILVSDREVDFHLFQIARESGQDYSSLRNAAWLSGGSQEIRERALAEKAMEWLYDKARKIEMDGDGNPLPPPETASGEESGEGGLAPGGAERDEAAE
jgi:trigger factor